MFYTNNLTVLQSRERNGGFCILYIHTHWSDISLIYRETELSIIYSSALSACIIFPFSKGNLMPQPVL